MLFDWVNEPEVRASAFCPEPIPWERHRGWFDDRLAGDRSRIFIALDADDRPAGQVRFDLRGDDEADPPRAPWSRRYINQQMQRLRQMFKWAASHEMLPSAVYEALTTVAAAFPKVTLFSVGSVEKPLPVTAIIAA